MIRNYQRSSSSSDVDLSPIYSSLQTINAFLFEIDLQTTLPKAVSSLSSDLNNLENSIISLSSEFMEQSTIPSAISELSQDVTELQEIISTLSFDYDMAFITDPVLTKNITEYNTYYNKNIEIFEPYVQSINNYEYIANTYANQRMNLPNAILNDTNLNTMVQLKSYTLNKIENGSYLLSNCLVNTVINTLCGLYSCTVDYVTGSQVQFGMGKAHTISCNMGEIGYCNVDNLVITGAGVLNCASVLLSYNASNCSFTGCVLPSIMTSGNSYNSMTLNDISKLQSVSLANCVINNKQTAGYYSACSFNNVSFPNLNTTAFNNCSGTIYVPKIVNNSVLFDVNNKYMYGGGGALEVSCLPEYDIQLPPNKVVISNAYVGDYINLNFDQYSTNLFNFKACTGNMQINCTSCNAFVFSSNSFHNADINILSYNSSTFQKNTITDCTLNWYGDVSNSLAIAQNKIVNLELNAYGSGDDKYLQNNSISNLKINMYGNNSFTHVSASYYNAYLQGYNEINQCNITNITNENLCNYYDCTINNLQVNSKATIINCTVSRLYVLPNASALYSIQRNSIGTLIIPNYMSNINIDNTVGNIVTY